MKNAQNEVSYEDAGYNRFFRRTLSSNATETNLKNLGANRQYQPQDLNFDGRQTSGSLGDIFRVGQQIEINGPRVGVIVKDIEGVDVGIFGDIEVK